MIAKTGVLELPTNSNTLDIATAIELPTNSKMPPTTTLPGNASKYELKTIMSMAKVKYYAKENTKLGTHSFYAVPVPNGTLTFDEVCEEACRNTSIEPTIMKAAVAEYMKTVQSNVLKGFRVPVGDKFLTVYPNLNASVKDVKDASGKVTEVATAKALTANKGKSRLGASVSVKFSQEFAANVSWQKIDERTGAAVEEEDITDNSGSGGSDSGSDTSLEP